MAKHEASDRAAMVALLRHRGVRDPRVLAAFEAVPREAFVDAAHAAQAYADLPLPIGHGQTISQPYVVAITVAALNLTGDEHVLEVGTGSGYAAAILGQLARRVDTIERIAELAERATAALASYPNVVVHHGDGTLGWPVGAPYAAIAVAANAPAPPPTLLAQLAIGGRMVLPFGRDGDQRLVLIVHEADRFVHHDLGAVRFVPLVGTEGW